ncbi:unnamed protein product [Hymenolepis diminuta]|uniref:Methionine--tRNA ligase, mitochondrial n=1 Tax=Hymenolepis diminuta TaxID=6216 RepID=A0A0R3SR32_HYMDI|nr:unnamed protein product [Hymenolepis diminuta]
MRSFITAPIFYANAKPHLGHAYTLCMADTWSRFSAIRHHPSLQAFPPRRVSMRPSINRTAFLCTGVDEHGSKIARTAMDRNCSPQELCDKVSLSFIDLCSQLNISTGVFIRTTSDAHKAVVHNAWKRLENSGHLYWSTFSGWYSTTDEAFYADWEVIDDYDKGVKVAKISGNEVQWVEEETCRFRLADFKHRLHEWLDSGVLPKESQEHSRLLSLTHSSLDLLEDPSVSRPKSRVPWGISVPDRPDQTIYVWFDALMSYLTAGKVSLVSGADNTETIWPPECQFIGKDILRFHAILWPAILMAMGLPLPKLIIPHGHILVSGTKMSKSLGNVVSHDDVLYHFASCFTQNNVFTESEAHAFAADCLRYCLIRSACLQEDITFSLPLAIETVNTELVNWLGNLLSRITSKKVTPTQNAPILDIMEAQDFMSDPVDADLRNLPSTVDSLWFDHLQPHHGVDAIMRVVRHANAFVDRHRPWDTTTKSSSQTVVGVVLETLRLVGCLLTPLTPTLSNRLLNAIGLQERILRCSTWRLPNDGLLKRPLVPRFRP